MRKRCPPPVRPRSARPLEGLGGPGRRREKGGRDPRPPVGLGRTQKNVYIRRRIDTSRTAPGVPLFSRVDASPGAPRTVCRRPGARPVRGWSAARSFSGRSPSFERVRARRRGRAPGRGPFEVSKSICIRRRGHDSGRPRRSHTSIEDHFGPNFIVRRGGRVATPRPLSPGLGRARGSSRHDPAARRSRYHHKLPR